MDLMVVGEAPQKKVDTKSLLLMTGSLLVLGWLFKEIVYGD